MTNTQLRRYVDEGVVIIITTNSEQHPADQEMSKIGELVFSKQ